MGKNKAVDTTNQITQQSLELSKEQAAKAAAREKRMDQYLKPAIDYNTALASGDRTLATQAVAPLITGYNDASKLTKESIYETLPAGAGRDVALAENERSRRTAVSTATTGATIGAFDKLANIGSGMGSFSLNELGASLRGLEGASSSNAQAVRAESERKASTMGFLGSLVGAGASLATGGFSSMAKPKAAPAPAPSGGWG